MSVRTQRTHMMGFSNRNEVNYKKQGTDKLFQRSFIKSKSQYCSQNNKSVHGTQNKLQSLMNKDNLNQTMGNIEYSKTHDFNTLYKNSEKGHHFQYETQRFNSSAKRPYMYKKYKPMYSPLPLDFSKKINDGLTQDLKNFSSKQISLFKIKQLKQTFLRNNRNRKNLKQFYTKFTNNQGLIDKKGFQKLVKEFGFDLNQKQVDLIFKLNNSHEQNTQNKQNKQNSLNLGDFINLMTKQNIYFKTLKVKEQETHKFRFSQPDFQIFRNKFSRLKQSFRVYKDQKIDLQKFQKIMKKLDITDLILKVDKREDIFNQFINQNGQLNVESMLSTIVVQQHQRIQKSSSKKPQNTLKHDFTQNLNVKKQQKYLNSQKDPLNQLLYPLNLKRSSLNQYQRNLKYAKDICEKLKYIKQKSGKDIIKQVFNKSNQKVQNKQTIYKNVQKILQNEGYNFNKDQYKAFISYLDFDSKNQIEQSDFQKYVFRQNQNQIIDRLDRRKRAPCSNKYLEQSHSKIYQNEEQINQCNDFYNQSRNSNTRSRSCINWLHTKKSIIKQQNVPQFYVPTKFSAWPSRLYETNLSMIQPSSLTGMGITESNRFLKNQKHTYGQQQRQKKIMKYENKLRKTTEWQNNLLNRMQVQNKVQDQKGLTKNYNLRLLKEQYENNCHNIAHT